MDKNAGFKNQNKSTTHRFVRKQKGTINGSTHDLMHPQYVEWIMKLNQKIKHKAIKVIIFRSYVCVLWWPYVNPFWLVSLLRLSLYQFIWTHKIILHKLAKSRSPSHWLTLEDFSGWADFWGLFVVFGQMYNLLLMDNLWKHSALPHTHTPTRARTHTQSKIHLLCL